MKFSILLLCLIIAAASFASQSYAQTKTSTTSASPSVNEDQVERIKDIVASRVAELNLVEKKGVLGKVLSNTSAQITIEDINGDKRIIEIDELTKFKDPADDDFGISDIKTGATLGIIGLHNKTTDRILARFINTVTTVPEYFDGVIAEIDTKNFQLHAVDENGKKRIVDIVPSTKTSSYDAENGMVKSGFSKVKIGQRIHAAGFTDAKNKEQLNATRVIHFLDINPSEKMNSYIEAVEKTSLTPTEE